MSSIEVVFDVNLDDNNNNHNRDEDDDESIDEAVDSINLGGAGSNNPKNRSSSKNHDNSEEDEEDSDDDATVGYDPVNYGTINQQCGEDSSDDEDSVELKRRLFPSSQRRSQTSFWKMKMMRSLHQRQRKRRGS